MNTRLDKDTYIRAVAFFTLVVGALVAGGAMESYTWPMTWQLLLGTFVGCVICIFAFTASNNPVISGLGVSGMSLLLGIMIGPLVATYSDFVVLEAIVTTGLIMIVMSLAGIMFPQVFEGWGPALLAGLTILIVAQFAQIALIAFGFTGASDMPLLVWGGVVIFTGLVAYDWAKALTLEYTLDNAIDSAGGLILDAVNLFIRLLQIYGGSNRRGRG